jgi:hypothetical protein
MSGRLALLAPLALSALGLAACSSAAPAGVAAVPASPNASISSGTALERFFPLVDGRVYAWATTNDRGEAGVLSARVRRTEPGAGDLVVGTVTRRFRYEDGGVVTISRVGAASFVLKAPLEAGAAWPGEHGGRTVVDRVGVSIDVPAGHFDGCVVTREHAAGMPPVRYDTTFCPGTGIVRLDVESGATRERAELTSYGEAVTIEGEGLRRLP